MCVIFPNNTDSSNRTWCDVNGVSCVSELSVTGCMQHIGHIAVAATEALAVSDPAVISDITWLLVQFSDWLHTALLLCFRADNQVSFSLRYSIIADKVGK